MFRAARPRFPDCRQLPGSVGKARAAPAGATGRKKRQRDFAVRSDVVIFAGMKPASAPEAAEAAAVKVSFVIPVYNRPAEVSELLESLAGQEKAQGCFEVILVEDGSTLPCRAEAERFAGRLPLTYLTKPNSGPGPSRNFGAGKARGEYVVFLDSDVVLPPGYVAALLASLAATPCDAFGGPDRAHPSFTPMQKAINYAMTSFFTTGGIRGGKRKMDKFYPRSFNMGVRRDVFLRLGGFADMRFGEDIDLSTRLFEDGCSCRLLPEAWVWHKRRTDLRKFFRQVHNSGIARINLTKRHPGTLKLVHLLPAVFTVGCVVLLVGALWCPWSLLPLALFALLIFVDAALREGSPAVGALAVAAAYVQLTGYGSGFLRAWWRRCVRGRGEFDAFRKNFYK